jgi:hypothetical protein
MENSQKLQFISKSISSVPGNAKHILKAKKERLQYYNENIERLINVSEEQLKNHNFTNEVLNASQMILKRNLLPKLLKKVYRLERHAYAPEMNKLHFKNNEFVKVPQRKTIEDALTCVINTMSLDHLIKLSK